MEAEGTDPGGVVHPPFDGDGTGDLFPGIADLRVEEILALKDGSSLAELAARYKEKSAADGLALRVSTSFGSRLYRAEDGLTIIAVRPDGSETDITAAVLRTAGAGGQEKEGDS